MKKQISLLNKKIEYTLNISRRARCLRLAIYPDASIVVTAPRYISFSLIEKFIIDKSHWIISKIDFFKSHPRLANKRTRQDYLEYKDRAFSLAQTRLNHFNKIYGFKINKFNIRNQKTRWGSCSKKGTLNFNYKIVLLPNYLADYIIVHELCHLKEFNHSAKFWNLVAKTIPNYLELRRELKTIGLTL